MDIEQKKKELAELLKISEKQQRIGEINGLMTRPDFWSNQENARAISQELASLNNLIAQFNQAINEEEIKKLEFQTLFSGDYDQSSAIVSIHAGAGGTEAQDWADMLLKMLERWAAKKEFKCKMIDISEGEEAGIKSATIQIKGYGVFGWLKSESGVHRLVRISPYDADKARHTSFALIEVIPETEKSKEVIIDEKDLKIDFYRAGGHGGQNVNKVETAVRITHISTGTVAACQNERSQSQNKELALKVLQAKLYKLKLEQDEKDRQSMRGEFQSPEWGSQIRSYVMMPYQLVKDHRTGVEETDINSVLNGELDKFMIGYLRYTTNGTNRNELHK